MKKKLKQLMILLIFIVAVRGIYLSTIKEYNTTYKIDSYKVEESYHQNPKETRLFKIAKGKKTYVFEINKNLGKAKKIIKEIRQDKEGAVECILPIYKKDVENEVYCRVNDEQVSLDYLKENEDFQKIKESLKKYKIQFPKSSDIKEKYKSITIYSNNILKNQVYYIWNYKGVYIIDSMSHKYESILDYDLYDNVLTCTVKNRFVLLENNSVNGIKNIYYYDYDRKKIRVAKLEKEISKDSYINGVEGKLIYITDRKLKKQYTLDIFKEKLEEIDDEETVYTTYQEGKKKEMSKSDFFLNDQYFDDKVVDGVYYFQEDNKIYKSYDKEKKNKVLLLELDNIKEWSIKNGEILILREDTLYAYNDKNGLREIIKNKELQYNYESIYQLGEM